jgi:uncharacterized heparinase superfamily protein
VLSQARGPEAGEGLLAGLRRLTYASPVYSYTLLGRVPKRLLGTPPEVVPGNAAAGQAILAGQLTFGGTRHALADAPRDANSDADEAWLAYYHGFTWLSDLRRVGTDAARERAREQILGWIQRHRHWTPLPWRPDILGERLASWLTHFGFYAANRDGRFLDELFAEIARQARHLARTAPKASTGPWRITALKGLIYCGVALPDSDRWLHGGLKQLETELQRQVHPDGGHASRNPSIQLRLFGDLLALRETLLAAHIELPGWLSETIERMAPMLRALRHGDGGLALFNGSSAEDPAIIDWMLTRANVKSRTAASAPHSGFHRLAAGRTTVIIDAGTPPPPGVNPWAHAGTLSFEMSAGRERLIVNCGAAPARGSAWRHALRSTAAHSTVIVDARNSSEIEPDGGYTRPPRHIASSRREIDGSTIIEATAEGYGEITGLVHRRLLMLAPDGGELQGEDRLAGGAPQMATARFHLHPTVQATLIQGGHAVLLKPRRGKGWRFDCGDDAAMLEESVYFESSQARRRTLQIVLNRAFEPSGITFKWRLTRL